MRIHNKNSGLITMAALLALAFTAHAQITPSNKSTTQPADNSAGTAQTKKPTQSTPAPAAPKTNSAAQGAKPATGTDAAGSMTDKQKESYALGMNIGRGLSQQVSDLDTAAVIQGLKDTLTNSKLALTDEQAMAALTQLQQQVKAKEDAQMAQLADQNQKEGEAFLAENKKKDGVVALPSGLQYKVITQGTGPKPAATDTVVCNYRGTLLDGTEFDSSYKRGQPATFPLNRVIKGWTEGVQLMPVGSKYQFFIPSALAYGPNGAGGVIGPNATLIFEVELVSIQGK